VLTIHYKKWLFVFIIYISISCSSTKIFYNYADYFLINWFESYLGLSMNQRSDLNIKVEKFLIWHRKSELPKIILFLEELKVRYKDGFDKQDIEWVRLESKKILQRVLIYSEMDIVSFLLKIDDKQILNAKNKLSIKKDDWLIKQSMMTSEELRDHILDRSYEFLEDWFGSLEFSQRKKIATWVKSDHNWVDIRLRNREKFQYDIIELLKSKKSLKENVHFWVLNIESHWTEEYKNAIEDKRQEWEMITLMIDASTLPHQRSHVLSKLDKYIEDFKDLSSIERKISD